MSTESELLRLVLALRTGFASIEPLHGTSAPLPTPANLLRDLPLSPGEREALDLLVETHLERFGGARESLSALPTDPELLGRLLGLPLDEKQRDLLLAWTGETATEGETLLQIGGAPEGEAASRPAPETRRDKAPGETNTEAESPASASGGAAKAKSGDTLGKLELRGEIARGGMGAILDARDPDLDREIAVKVMLSAVRDDPEVVARFVKEAQVQGRLEHPNVCPVHELGLDSSGAPYFAMKRVRGQALSDVIEEYHDGHGVILIRLVEIFLKVCDGVAFAHSRGIIHRDLKPANVMVGEYGEVLVMDWGLSKVLSDRPDPPSPASLQAGAPVETDSPDSEKVVTLRTGPPLDRTGERATSNQEDQATRARTLEGDVMGTPSYMPPEQADGAVSRMDERSDIYSLGAILYEVLAGVPPFSGAPHNVLFQVIEGKLTPPSRESGMPVPRELEAVVLKAMSKDPEDRYPAVEALRADIEAWTEGRVLQAAEYSALERAAKWVRRNRALSGLMGVIFLAVLVVGAVLFWSAAAQRIARKTGERVAREEQARAARAAVESDLAEAQKRLEKCRSEYRKAVNARQVDMAVIPSEQSTKFAIAVEQGPLTSGGPSTEDAPPPEWREAPEPPPPVGVLVRRLGRVPLDGAMAAGTLAVLFADRARSRATREGFEERLEEIEGTLAECRLAHGRALGAAGDSEKAERELGKVPEGYPGREGALLYARGSCPLDVHTQPDGVAVSLFSLPRESATSGKDSVRAGITPVAWRDLPEGAYVLRLGKDGFAPVAYVLRLARELPPEAAHELAVLARRRPGFQEAYEREGKRLPGSSPAQRRVFVKLYPRDVVHKDLVAIPAGSFLLGEQKIPAFLETYLAAETEFTAVAWLHFWTKEGPRKRSHKSKSTLDQEADYLWTKLFAKVENMRDLPGAGLSWNDARCYLRWLNRRIRGAPGLFLLPTEAMWEKAARGVDGRIYPWGDRYDREKVNGMELRPIQTGVSRFLKNFDAVHVDRGVSVYGLKHVVGNVNEWCLSRDATSKKARILRGGAFSYGDAKLRLPTRHLYAAHTRYNSYGFRYFFVLKPEHR